MKNSLYILVIVIMTLLAGCDKYDHAIADMEDRFDTMEGTTISSIRQQISSINVSLENLEDVYGILCNVYKGLEIEILELQGVLNQLPEGATERVEILRQMEEKKEFITVLEMKNTEVGARIINLDVYVKEEMEGATNWEEITLSTLNQYEDLQILIADIKRIFNEYSTSLTTEELSSFHTAVSALEVSMEKWVNKLITNCFKEIAEIDVMLHALAAEVESEQQLNQEVIELQQLLHQAKIELTTVCYQAIEEAVENNNGLITDQINDAIQVAKTSLQNQINTINVQIADINDRLTALEKRIQAIRFAPEYADGKVLVDPSNNIVLKYMLSPASAAEHVDKDFVTAYISCTQSRHGAEPKQLTVSNVSGSSDGTLTVVIACHLEDEYFDQTNEAKICIKINDDNNDVISEWVPAFWNYRIVVKETNNYPTYEVYTPKGLLKWLYMYHKQEGKVNLSVMDDITLEPFSIEKDATDETYGYTEHEITTLDQITPSGNNWSTVAVGDNDVWKHVTNSGLIDGHGHRIKGIRSNDGSALVGENGQTGTIRNLVLEDVVIVAEGNVGAFAAHNAGVIENCLVKSGYLKSTGSDKICVGGIAGSTGDEATEASIANCKNYATIYNRGSYTGGITGWLNAQSIVSDCINYGNVKSEGTYVGGLIGYSQEIVNRLINYGNVSTTNKNGCAGGIMGNNDLSLIGTDCNNFGTITIGGN